MSDIVLSAGVRSNLLQLQQTGTLITLTQNRLATGKRVNSALDNPTNYFTAQGLQSRASDLSSLLDLESNAIQHDPGRQQRHLRDHQARAVRPGPARQAQQTSDTAERTSLGSQFDDILTQIDQLAGDSSFNGMNLLTGRQPRTWCSTNRAPRAHHHRRRPTTSTGLAIANVVHTG